MNVHLDKQTNIEKAGPHGWCLQGFRVRWCTATTVWASIARWRRHSPSSWRRLGLMQPVIRRPSRPRCRRVSRHHGGFLGFGVWKMFQERNYQGHCFQASYSCFCFGNLKDLTGKHPMKGFKATCPEKHDQRDCWIERSCPGSFDRGQQSVCCQELKRLGAKVCPWWKSLHCFRVSAVARPQQITTYDTYAHWHMQCPTVTQTYINCT